MEYYNSTQPRGSSRDSRVTLPPVTRTPARRAEAGHSAGYCPPPRPFCAQDYMRAIYDKYARLASREVNAQLGSVKPPGMPAREWDALRRAGRRGSVAHRAPKITGDLGGHRSRSSSAS